MGIGAIEILFLANCDTLTHMSGRYYRRSVISSLPALLGGVAGCTVFSDYSRVIGIEVINQTADELIAEIEIREDGTVLAQQRVDLPADQPDADDRHSSVFTQASLADIPEGTVLTAELFVDDQRTETVRFTADCEIGEEYTGDGVSFRIQDDSIDTHTGFCTTEDLPQ